MNIHRARMRSTAATETFQKLLKRPCFKLPRHSVNGRISVIGFSYAGKRTWAIYTAFAYLFLITTTTPHNTSYSCVYVENDGIGDRIA
ncbi:hypothetical protein TNCV_1657511 [Trichonephila clavipes]|nr:hypothetical protein TNCV_1657511 [Trichonephila clavipes]